MAHLCDGHRYWEARGEGYVEIIYSMRREEYWNVVAFRRNEITPLTPPILQRAIIKYKKNDIVPTSLNNFFVVVNTTKFRNLFHVECWRWSGGCSSLSGEMCLGQVQ